MKKIVIGIVIAVFILTAVIFWVFKNSSYLSFDDSKQTYEIVKDWDMPNVLDEISGLSWIGNNEIACIQDENGKIFIYNLKSKKIVFEMTFAEDGDYEAIAVNGATAYVLRSDGRIYEISNYRNENFQVADYKTFLEQNDVEGLCIDKWNNRLLLAVKNKQNEDDQFKGIYAFNLNTKQLNETPIFKLHVNDSIFETLEGNGRDDIIRPSEIELNPKTKELYILEGHRPKLLILDQNGKSKKVHLLDPEYFQQPEGLTFDRTGNLYISNESRRAPANILQIKLN